MSAVAVGSTHAPARAWTPDALVGTLRGLEGETVLLETEGGMVSLEMNNIAKARLTL